MKERTLLKVVGTAIQGSIGSKLETTVGRGVVQLRRGQSVLDFVTEFLNDRGVSSFTLHQRDFDTWATSPMMFMTMNPMLVLTYTFTEFPLSETGFYTKDLTLYERTRDLKSLKRILNG